MGRVLLRPVENKRRIALFMPRGLFFPRYKEMSMGGSHSRRWDDVRKRREGM